MKSEVYWEGFVDHNKDSGFYAEGDGKPLVLRRGVTGIDSHFNRINLAALLRTGWVGQRMKQRRGLYNSDLK